MPEVQKKLLCLIQKQGLNLGDKRSAPKILNLSSIYISNSSSNNHKKNSKYENRNNDYENGNENSDKEDREYFIIW